MARMVDVVSLSLGYFDESAADVCYSSGLWQVIELLLEMGVAVIGRGRELLDQPQVLPRGLQPPDRRRAHPGASASARSTRNGSKALFSDGGRWVTAWAAGAAVVSIFPDGHQRQPHSRRCGHTRTRTTGRRGSQGCPPTARRSIPTITTAASRCGAARRSRLRSSPRSSPRSSWRTPPAPRWGWTQPGAQAATDRRGRRRSRPCARTRTPGNRADRWTTRRPRPRLPAGPIAARAWPTWWTRPRTETTTPSASWSPSCSPMLWQVARATGLGADDAEDVLQTVWTRLLASLGDIRSSSGGHRLAGPDHPARGVAGACDHEEAAARRPGMADGAPRPRAWLRGTGDHQRSASCPLAGHRAGSRRGARQLLRIIAFVPRPDYQAVAAALGMPIGSIGPTRGRCLAKLRALLAQ